MGVFAGSGSTGVGVGGGGSVAVGGSTRPVTPYSSDREAMLLLIRKGEYETAAKRLEELHAADPDDWRTQFYLGLAYVGQEQFDKGYGLIKTIVIPFAFQEKMEIKCTAEYVEEKKMPGPEAVKTMLDYFAISEQRQDYRDRPPPFGDPDLIYDCPPFLRAPLF
ncbi:tetratricopeptide repeat protein [Desulfovibrio sp. X2]|uniref:tetratricopeptide repeat protein n=1 Tax=Desulfovibrio sp. X2 TaxID=941449 RepID=UPI00191C5131|nr:tetratricopeptide repeat protein [Desulfovibrio sp. X2]